MVLLLLATLHVAQLPKSDISLDSFYQTRNSNSKFADLPRLQVSSILGPTIRPIKQYILRQMPY